MSATIDPGAGFRLLKWQRDHFAAGDETWANGTGPWLPTDLPVGEMYRPALHHPHRRRIAQPAPTPPAGSLVERIQALPCNKFTSPNLSEDRDLWYDNGFEDCKQAAAELVVAVEGRVARLEAALIRLRDCDWVITPHDRMDAVRAIAREALAATPNAASASGEEAKPC